MKCPGRFVRLAAHVFQGPARLSSAILSVLALTGERTDAFNGWFYYGMRMHIGTPCNQSGAKGPCVQLSEVLADRCCRLEGAVKGLASDTCSGHTYGHDKKTDKLQL